MKKILEYSYWIPVLGVIIVWFLGPEDLSDKFYESKLHYTGSLLLQVVCANLFIAWIFLQ